MIGVLGGKVPPGGGWSKGDVWYLGKMAHREGRCARGGEGVGRERGLGI